jgi:hypothetical protein
VAAITRSARLRERLARIQGELKRVRSEERVLVEQVAFLAGVTDDAETRRLVAETPLADREWQEAATNLDRHEQALREARERAARLEADRDALLDELIEMEETR